MKKFLITTYHALLIFVWAASAISVISGTVWFIVPFLCATFAIGMMLRSET